MLSSKECPSIKVDEYAINYKEVKNWLDTFVAMRRVCCIHNVYSQELNFKTVGKQEVKFKKYLSSMSTHIIQNDSQHSYSALFVWLLDSHSLGLVPFGLVPFELVHFIFLSF